MMQHAPLVSDPKLDPPTAALAPRRAVRCAGRGGWRALALVAGLGLASASTLAATPAFARSGALDSTAYSDVAERAVRSVVNVATTRRAPTQHNPAMVPPWFSDRGVERPASLGSGVIVSRDGLVLTNNHVVEHAAGIEITLHDGRKLIAKLVGRDPQSDVAVLRIQAPPADLEPMPVADSGQVRLGEIVLAIGSPFGLAQTVTLGIISAKGRANVGIVDYEDFIQTDAAINPGNSGGALVNAVGQLVGINTAIASRSGGSQGIGFAIPSAMAMSILRSLVEKGTVERGWLGVRIQDLDAVAAQQAGLRDRPGVRIVEVEPRSPAALGGLRPGDIVTAVDGGAVHDTARLRIRVASLQPGTTARFDIWRDQRALTAQVKLGRAYSLAVAGDAGR